MLLKLTLPPGYWLYKKLHIGFYYYYYYYFYIFLTSTDLFRFNPRCGFSGYNYSRLLQYHDENTYTWYMLELAGSQLFC